MQRARRCDGSGSSCASAAVRFGWREAGCCSHPICGRGTHSAYLKSEKIPLFGLAEASHVEKVFVWTGARSAENTECFLLHASPTGAVGKETPFVCVRRTAWLIEAREAPQGSLISSFPAPSVSRCSDMDLLTAHFSPVFLLASLEPRPHLQKPHEGQLLADREIQINPQDSSCLFISASPVPAAHRLTLFFITLNCNAFED